MFTDEENKPQENTNPKDSQSEGTNQRRPHRPRIPGRMAYDNNEYERPQRPYRPRYNADDKDMNSREGYGHGYGQGQGQQRYGGYQPRPRYGEDRREGGYQPRQRYYGDDRREGGYQPRQRFGDDRREGGYQGFARDHREQPRPRYGGSQEGYQPQQREGGYQPRPRFNANGGPNRGGNREGGYGHRAYGQSQGQNRYGGGYRQHTADYNPHAKYSMKKQIEYKETHFDPDAPIRLNRFLANAGVCSRREADTFITAGVVTVNGEIVTELGTKVKRSDEVKFHDQPVNIEKKVYVLLNKPKDYVTTSDDPQNRKTVMDLVKNACRERIYPVGRLDRNTTGVLLFTNDGDLATKLTHPQYLKKKVYHVYLDKNVSVEDLHHIMNGVELEDGVIKADAVDYADEKDKKQVGIEIHSGKNRIVRRIFEHLGYRVCKLDRVLFAGLTKKNLRRGDWRFLTEKEVNMLRMGAFE